MRFFSFLFILLFIAQSALSAQQTIRILNTDAEPLIGVHIRAQSIDFSGISDEMGRASLPQCPSNTVFSFSYLGYADLSIAIGEISNGTIVLATAIDELSTVEVVGRRADRLESTPVLVDKMSAKDIQLTNAQTTVDALQNSGSVFVQKSQGGGGSPIVRGFEANRLLLVMDGVRMNNAIYRNGHLQNAITVDNNVLENIEVIHGPGALIYGSDALGGVVHFKTIDPILSQGDSATIHGKVASRFASANSATDIHAQFNYGRKKWGVITGASRHIYGDTRSGKNYVNGFDGFGQRPIYAKRIDGKDSIFVNKDPFLQVGTAYTQYDFFQKWKYKVNDVLHLGLNVQYSTSSDIPRYDRLTEYKGEQLKFADWYYGPQKRFMAAASAKLLASNRLYDKANIIVAYQQIGEDRYKRKLHKTALGTSLVDVDVVTANLDFDKLLTGHHRLIYGIDMALNWVESEAFDRDIVTNEISYAVDGRYPTAGSSLYSGGAYLAWRWNNAQETLWTEAGARYALSSIASTFENRGAIAWPAEYTDGITTTNTAFTGSVGLNWKPTQNWHFRWLAASAFRAPNVDDLTRIREKNGFVTIPNAELKPEYSRNTEITIKWQNDAQNLSINTTAFYTQLKDAIVRQVGTLPDGTDFLLLDGDSLTLLPNINADDAWVYGFSGNIKWNFAKYFAIESGLSWTKGERNYHQTNDAGEVVYSTIAPLDHIPPMYGKTSIVYNNQALTIKAVARYNAAKQLEDYAISDYTYDENTGKWLANRTGTSDNIHQTPTDEEGNFEGSYQWTTFNLYSSYQFDSGLGINLAVENITDVHYRSFSSGMSAPGRNLVIGIKYAF